MRTDVGNRGLVAAEMAFQPPGRLMQREIQVAFRALERLAAGSAKRIRKRAAPVHEQDRLTPRGKRPVHRADQFPAEKRSIPVLKLLSKIDNGRLWDGRQPGTRRHPQKSPTGPLRLVPRATVGVAEPKTTAAPAIFP